MKILLTSVGRRSYLVKYFKEAVGENGEIHVSNSTSITPAFQFADKNTVTPLIYDENYIPYLLDYCQKNSIDAIISLFDIDLLILSSNKKLFEDIGTKVIVSDEDVIKICNDKYETYQFLLKNNIRTPKTYIDLNTAIQSIKKGDIMYPVILKPRWGMGSIGIYEAENEEELEILYKKVYREIQNTYLKYESKNTMKNSVLIQEKINGEEFGLDIINDLNSNYQNTISKRKFAMRSGETDCAEIVHDESLSNIGKSLSTALGHVANLDVDVFVSDNIPYVLEMNARFGGGYPFSHQAGINLPLAIVNWIKGIETDSLLFKAEVGVISHKDIVIQRLEKKNEPCLVDKITKIESVDQIISILNKFDKVFTPSISSRIINFNEYARKLLTQAYVYATYDDFGEILGFCAFYANDQVNKTGYLAFLGVLPYSQNKSLGQSLLNKCLDISKENNMEFLKLEVQKNNKKALNFYNKNNFEIINESNKNALYMLKRIKKDSEL